MIVVVFFVFLFFLMGCIAWYISHKGWEYRRVGLFLDFIDRVDNDIHKANNY